jgi:hypothetical protein
MSVPVTDAEVQALMRRYDPQTGPTRWPDGTLIYRIARDLFAARAALRTIGGTIVEEALRGTNGQSQNF